MDNLINQIKVELIKALHLDGMKPEDLDADAPLFGEGGIGLDSIDALEIIVMLEKNYGIRLANAKEGKDVFKSVRIMAEYIEQNRKK